MLLQFKDGNMLRYLAQQKVHPCNPEKMILCTQQRSFKPIIETIEPAIKKERSDIQFSVKKTTFYVKFIF